ncbi:HAD family hydrolase [Leifsonia sp. McL0607]|uniref:HAD family hydrolase n=1 Tax=Leifsonia sp. McL0607 TaxID=3415672 RepID=UPI003CFA3699
MSVDFSGTLTSPTEVVDPERTWRSYLDALVDSGQLSAVVADLRLRALLAGEGRSWTACVDHGESYSIARILHEAHVPVAEAAMESFREAFSQHMLLTPSAREALEDLQRAGVAVVLLSNSLWPRDWFVRALTEQGVIGSFDAIVVSSETPYCKPNPAVFAIAMAELKANANETVHIGDRAFEDVKGGLSAGMRVIHFGEHRIDSDQGGRLRGMNNWAELPESLTNWPANEL